MAERSTPTRASSWVAEERPRGDPWHAVGSLVAGVALYGVLGWLADRLLGTTWLVAVGIVVGAVLGLYSVWRRFVSPVPVEPRVTPSVDPRQEDR